ncbi:MAG: HAMP domain-containing sensor histidine kinase [candidate division Zixibacteria bacterium]
MSNKTVGLIIALIVGALSGLVVLQIMLLNYAIDLKKQAFRRNVNASMALATQKLITNELIDFTLFQRNVEDSISIQINGVNSDSLDNHVISEKAIIRAKRFGADSIKCIDQYRIDNGVLSYPVRVPQRMTIYSYNLDEGMDQIVVDTFLQEGEYRLNLEDHLLNRGRFLVKIVSDSSSATLHWSDGVMGEISQEIVADSGHELILVNIMREFMSGSGNDKLDLPDPKLLDSLISQSLREYDIDLEYSFGIFESRGDSLVMLHSEEHKNELLNTNFRSQLFPMAPFMIGNELRLYFPGQRAFLWWETGPIFFLTFAFMLVIIGCFAYTIRTIIRQKRFSTLMVDFINNMTHEFKTPISTVKLACEAITRTDIIGQKEKVLQYSRMIQSENQRMSSQTEKILQMAVLEEGEVDLNLENVNVHEIILAEVGREALRIEHRKGKIETSLKAERNIIAADPIHLAGIIRNLLDNSSKYSPDIPIINVSTRNRKNYIQISISDKGRGISKADAGLVFDKYFRVPSGDVHDVKGFGLGLSYVKLMTDAMNGMVELKSELNKGTVITLVFPTIDAEAGRHEPEN